MLRSAVVGRLAVVVEGRPAIFPVNYVVDHGTLVFRTAQGTKLTGALTSPYVAFEVDGVEDQTASGTPEAWSVVLDGRVHEITRVDDVLAAAALPLHPWHAGPKGRYLRIEPHTITGRRFPITPATAWHTRFTGGRPTAPE
jgi:nitroimidazol reductase NimA-like FMN-containing flavoprotein (pyridoxamine 5'-phosphate oxidase superfamily)